jgi:hypothetical protein
MTEYANETNSSQEPYKPLNLQHKPELLQRIREFEKKLSLDVEQAVSVVAYASAKDEEELGHS